MDLASIIIITKNQSKYLCICIDSLLKQTYKNIEIIIVNNNSSDNTAQYVQSIQSDKIRYFLIKDNIGLAGLRNYGIIKSLGEYIFFTDSDCIATKNWVEEGMHLFLQKNYCGIEGKTIAEHQNFGLSDHVVENYKGGTYQTCNIAYKKKVLLEFDMFNNKYTLAYEDIDLALRIKKKYQIYFAEEMLILHQIVPWSIMSLLKNSFRGKYKVMLVKDHNYKKILQYRILEVNSLIQICFPFLMILYFRIKSPRDIFFLPLFYVRAIIHRLIIWKSAIFKKILIF